MRTRTVRSAALTAAALLALGACASGNGGGGGGDVDPGDFPEGSTMARLASAGSITIGTKFDQPLFGLMPPSGVPEGFDVEIGRIIASELGIDEDGIEWIETISANREPFIESSQVDIVIATYTINDTRKETVSFAGPYYYAGQSILTLATSDIQGPDDLAGASVCTVSGSTPEQNLVDNFPDTDVVPLGAYSECLPPLRDGRVDAVSTDNVILAGFAHESDGEFEVRGEPFTEEPYGIGLARTDDDFRSWINDVLEEIFEDGRWVAAWEETAGQVLPTPEPPTVDRYTN